MTTDPLYLSLLLALPLISGLATALLLRRHSPDDDQAQQGAQTQLALQAQQLSHLTQARDELKDEKQQLQQQLETRQQQQQQLHRERAELDSRLQETRQQLSEHKHHNQQLQQQLHDQQQQLSEQDAQLREQQTRLDAEQDKLQALKEQFEQQKSALKAEFKSVSEEIINTGRKTLHESNQQGLGDLLKPLQSQIDQFQQRVNQVHSDTLKGNSSLEAELKKVMDMGLKMRDEANNLTSALKGDAQQRGAWGEAQLERTLEMSGLAEDAHYAKQTAFKDNDGKRKQTDYLIKLPGNKHIIIDSKVSLLAYDKALTANEPSARALGLDEHIKAIKRHIDDLASKDYTNLSGLHSPSFVLMFMPIEPAYIEALKHSKDLFGYGYDKNIVLVSHTTLIPILRTVANLWMLEQSNHEAREISSKAGDIYNSVCTVAERLLKLGNTLNTASGHYNEVVKAIGGRQGLHGKVERFAQLSSKVSKSMPNLNEHQRDHDTQLLEVQPLPPADTTSEPTKPKPPPTS